MSLIFFLLSACGEKVYTVDDFKKDEKLLAEYITKCEKGELHPDDLNCINSKKAINSKFEFKLKG
ncbi:EexN family lipoprotein [Pasteurellaceae bacterium 20609_3]|uniref:EexN family lipoprotein n=1 Tax=Spirabiliibacterium mucosae TaxID=28156 RepID=UPI001AAD7B3C|nr:EexN family lipoprotein [Spirabiliibacterium mucosae]